MHKIFLLVAAGLAGVMAAKAQCVLQNNAKEPWYTISNGVFGLRVPKAGALNRHDWAPVQAVVYMQNGRLVPPPAQPAFLGDAGAATGNCNGFTPPYKMTEQVKALADSIVITYTYYFKNVSPCVNLGKNLDPGGAKTYTATVKIIKGEKCAAITDETGVALQYSIPVSYTGFTYTHARYRGAISNNIQEGYEYDCRNPAEKKLYGSSFGQRAGQLAGYDAQVDLQPQKKYGYLQVWNHSPVNSGWYWQAFHRATGGNPYAVGIFHGRFSRYIGSRQAAVRFSTGPQNELFINAGMYLLNSDNSFYNTIRQEWYIYAGRQEDVKEQEAFQPIGRLMNEKNGLAGRVDGYLKQVMQPAPNFLKGALYEDATTIQKTIARLRNGSPGYDHALYTKMMQQEGGHYGGSVIKAIQYPALVEKPCWTSEGYCLANPDPKMTRLDHIYQYIKECFDEVIYELKYGDGVYAAGIKNLDQYRRKGARHCGVDLAGSDVNNARNCNVGYDPAQKRLPVNELRYLGNCGSFTLKFPHYAQVFKRDAQAISLLLAADDDPWQKGPYGQKLTPAQRNTLLAIVSTYAHLLYDPDMYPDPANTAGGFDYGTLNVLPDFLGAKNFMGALFVNGPGMPANTSRKALEEVKSNLDTYLNEYGAPAGSTSYTATGLESTVESLLLMKKAGQNDLFASDKRLQHFSDFYLHLTTPPSVRFSHVPAAALLNNRVKPYRKIISYGDGQEKTALLPAFLSAGFRDQQPLLSQALFDVYRNGPPYPYQGRGYAALATDVSKAFAETGAGIKGYRIGNAHFPGYLAHFRSGFNTPAESSAWMINGNWYRDHRCEDEGELTLYALGNPLSISRSTSYEPRTNSARIRSVVIPFDMKADSRENFLNWNGTNQAIDRKDYGTGSTAPETNTVLQRLWKGSVAETSNITGFASFRNSAYTSARFTTFNKDRSWTRELMQLYFDEDHPVFVIKDSVSAGTENIWNMPFMSAGPIQKINTDNSVINYRPVDQLTPPRYDNEDLPDATPLGGAPMLTGIHRFRFTGQPWSPALDADRGIDWDLFTINSISKSRSFSTAQWTHIATPADLEKEEFLNTYRNDPFFAMERCDCKAGAQIVKTFYRTTHPLLNPAPRPLLSACPKGSDNITYTPFTAFRETHQFLRIKGSGNFFTIIVPYKKQQMPAALSLKEEAATGTGRQYVLRYNNVTIRFFDLNTVYTGNSRVVLSVVNTQGLNYEGMQLKGGPAEMEINAGTATVTVHGNKGLRTAKLPPGKKWVLQNKDAFIVFDATTGTATINYAGMSNYYWYSPSGPAANNPLVYKFTAR